MGICETKNNQVELNKTKENFPIKENYIIINESMKLNKIDLKSIRIKEGKVSQIHFEKVNRHTFNISESICKVKN